MVVGMKKIILLSLLSIIVLFIVGCKDCPSCPACVQRLCPEKICPSCPKCEDIKPQDKDLIVEYKGWKDGYNTYSILNPNQRKVLAQIETICYDGDDNEIPNNDKGKYFIDAMSGLNDNMLGSGLWRANCPEDHKKTSVKATIIG